MFISSTKTCYILDRMKVKINKYVFYIISLFFLVRFEVLMASSMKMTVFWVFALMMDTASTSENFYQTTWRNNPEDSYLLIFLV
jgi:hypothetical protein